MIKRKILALLAVLVFGSSMLGALPVYAQSSNTTQPNFFQGLINFIAQKFGLDKTQVQAAVTDYHNQQKQSRQAKMQQREKARLDQLVSQGKITKDQENLILNKLQEIQNNRQNWRNLSADQRKTAMQQERTDLQNWAKQNNINLQYLMGFGRMGPKRGWGWNK